MKTFLITFFFFLPSLVSAKLELVNTNQDKRVEKFIEDVSDILPKSFIDDLNQKIEIKFEKLDNHNSLLSPCEVKQVFGKQVRNTIILNRNLLPYIDSIETARNDFECGHKSYKRLAIATLIHEIAHVYDNAKKVSQDPGYLSLVNVGKNFGLRTKIKNTKLDRSPDPYEYTDLSEHFAVNTEYFLLDSEYKCRRPNLNRYLNDKFQASKEECFNFPEINIFTGEGKENITFDPANVKKISFVLAGKGKAAMSKFGHAMFKLELKQPAKDIMVGFLGVIDDTAINNYKGITGAYPSRLTIGLYNETITRYTKKEFRSLSEYELVMKENQKRDFLQHVVSLYFEYSGRYYFVTNNCASEAINLLKVAYQSDAFFKENPITPNQVMETLHKHGIVNKHPLVIPAYTQTLQKIFANAQEVLVTNNFEEYFQMSADERRFQMKLNNSVSKASVRSLFAFEMALNSFIQEKIEADLLTEIRKLDEQDEIRKLSVEAVQLGNKLIDSETADKGYGIPMFHQDERNETEIMAQMNEIFTKLGEWGKDHLVSEAISEAQKTNENLEMIKGALRSL